jgi:MFS family permease
MASYGSLALAFLARPLGAAIFGHYGDRIGRKATLVTSLMLMGGCTLLIGFLPTHAQIGWWAPLILCLLRFGQGLGLGGEWGGAALLAVENAPPGWRARFGMFPQLGAPVGFIAANGLFLILATTLSDSDFLSWGWRLPFLASSVLVFLGLWVRLKLTETPEFAAARAESPPPAVPLATLLSSHLGAAIAGTFACAACFAVYYIATAFALGYGTTALKIDRSIFLSLQLGAILFMGGSIVIAGWWSDRSSPTRVLAWGCAGTVIMGLVFGPLLGAGALGPIFVALALALFLMGFVYGPLGAYLPALFPIQLRYTGASFAFNLGGILGGALAPIVATWLIAAQGVALVGLYMSAAAAISLAGLWWTSRHP